MREENIKYWQKWKGKKVNDLLVECAYFFNKNMNATFFKGDADAGTLRVKFELQYQTTLTIYTHQKILASHADYTEMDSTYMKLLQEEITAIKLENINPLESIYIK
jgi:hypothetical protein